MTTTIRGSTINLQSLVNMISLLDLGPRGSDITTLAQTALNLGIGLVIPAGTWLHKGLNIPDGATIIGYGTQSILKLADAANVSQLNVSSNCTLQNFILDGNKANQVGSNLNAINLIGAVRTKVFNVISKDAKGSGFYISSNATDIDILNSGVTGYVDSGIKVVSATNLLLSNPSIYNSDVTATGDAIGIISDGSTINGLTIDAPKVFTVTNRGIALIGNGAKNIFNVGINLPRIMGCSSHGIHLFNVNTASISNGHVKANGGDGVRLEGDVQNSRIMGMQINTNTGYGLREVANGSTPNNNGLIYNSLTANASNVQTKLGAQSFVV